MLAAAWVASDHADLWLPAALTVVSTIGWLPFLLAVVQFPSDGDLAFFASSLVLSPSFPLNVVLPAVALVCAVLVASLVSATGGAVLLRAIDRMSGAGTPRRSIVADHSSPFALSHVPSPSTITASSPSP